MSRELSIAEKRELLDLLEVRRLKRAKRDFRSFVRMVPLPGAPLTDEDECEDFYPEIVSPAAHHDLLIDVLQQAHERKLRRVMLFLPPGSGKSSYASVAFPPWAMGANPGSNIIAVSYGSELAKKFGRRCRQLVRSKEYQDIFATGLSGDNAAVDDWSLENGSTYMSGGILSGITGNRADCLLIDDPVRGREDADSETIRTKTWEAYLSDLRSRLKPNGAIILVQTRWHESDLAGLILPENYAGESGIIRSRTGEPWFVLNVPAQAEHKDDPLGRDPGEWLWTDWFSPEHWEAEKAVQTPRNWNALYQGRPSPEEGSYFLRKWLRWYEKAPPRDQLEIYGASDYATKDGEGDWTVHGVFGVDADENIFVLDWWREQTSSDVWVETVLDMVKRWDPIEWAEEKGQIIRSVGPFLEKRMMERRVFFYRRQFPSAVDKPTRAQSIRGRTAMGKLYLPVAAPWVQDLVGEMMSFPNGRTDDQVDVLALIGRLLRTLEGKRPPPQPPGPIEGLEQMTYDMLIDKQTRSRRSRLI